MAHFGFRAASSLISRGGEGLPLHILLFKITIFDKIDGKL